jgi:hypothetical protein
MSSPPVVEPALLKRGFIRGPAEEVSSEIPRFSTQGG